MRWNLRTFVGAGVLAVILAGLLYVAFREEPALVDLHTVEQDAMRVTINADGQTRIRDVFDVATPITGIALRAPVEVGDTVEAGETVVASVEPVEPALLDARSRIQAEAAVREAEAALHVAESEVRKAEEDRTYADQQFDRARQLVERNATSITRLEDAAQQLAIADAALDASRSRLDMASGGLDRARAVLITPEVDTGASGSCCVELTAPADGVVLERVIVSERPVLAGDLLLSIGDPSDLEIVADLLSSDAVGLEPGTRAIVERWGGPHPLEARLRRIEPAARTRVSALGIEEQRVDAVFDLVSPVDERPGLGHGFSVFLRIVEWEAEDVLQIPLSALFRDGDAWAVFVDDGGRARLQHVEPGRRNDMAAEIAAGLEAGDRVVVHPGDAIADDAAIAERSAPS
jgi:HlyD family secretion protein